MIRVVIKGGLGNQMFQYAYAKVIAEQYRLPLLLDLSFYSKEAVSRTYSLDKLSINEKSTTERPSKHIRSLWKRTLPINRLLMKMGLRPLNTVYLDGYWQTEKNFGGRNEFVRSLFKFPPPPIEWVQRVQNSNSVAVHVRRGDYLKIPRRQICNLDYFTQAMHLAESRLDEPTFFIFSDDIEWCEIIASKFKNVVLVRGCKSDLEDLHLMSLCKHMIMSNSSFSWWGAWLNESPGKLVFAPDKWIDDEKMNHEFMVIDEILPPRWIRVPIN